MRSYLIERYGRKDKGHKTLDKEISSWDIGHVGHIQRISMDIVQLDIKIKPYSSDQ